MVKWVTCREPLGLEFGAERPQGRAIVKIHIYKEVQDLYKLKNSLQNQHSIIPSFHYSIIPLFQVGGIQTIWLK
jgi:hypothetical protein